MNILFTFITVGDHYPVTGTYADTIRGLHWFVPWTACLPAQPDNDNRGVRS